MKQTMLVGFLGNGEVGSSLRRVYELAGFTEENLVVRDPFQGKLDSLSVCDIVNVCIPFDGYDAFYKVLKNLGLRDGCVVIVQSTTSLGCTDRLQDDLNKFVFVHSPVRGVHPNLTEALLTFEKYVGVSESHFHDESQKLRIVGHIESLNMKPVLCRARESELAKVVSTTLYGVNIAAITDVSRLCKASDTDFDKVFTRWQTGYNAGYASLGMPNVCRPVLTPVPQDQEGRQVIGGHCVIPNCMILKQHMGETNLSAFVLRYSDEGPFKHRAETA